jgi:PKD repeat protein
VYGPNIDCAGPGSCDATFLTGATWETLTAIPAGQSLFAGWDGCDQIVAGACKVLVGDANRTVTAHFNQPATLNITNPGNGTGIVEDIDCFLLFCTNGNVVRCDLGPGETCSHQFTPGSSVELGGNFDRRYDSLTWNGCDSVSDNNCTVTIGPAGKRVIALFERLPSIDPPPVAAFTIAPNPAMPEQPVTFDASGSNDPDGTITNYHWQFGDGSPPQDTTSPTTIHSYFCTGTVQVGLTVTDDSGQTAGFSVPLTITPQTGFPACGG